MELVLEVGNEEPFQECTARMDDEEGKENADELFHSADEALDRIVEVVGIASLAAALFQ